MSKRLPLPPWAEEMRRVFKGGMVSQFVLSGAICDLVPYEAKEEGVRFLSLEDFLDDVLFAPFDVVLHYDRGRGIRIRRGSEEFQKFLSARDAFERTSDAGRPTSDHRESPRALGILDRFLYYVLHRGQADASAKAPKVAIVLDFAQFSIPRGPALHLALRGSDDLIRVLNWASDPSILGAHILTCLVTENLNDVAKEIIDSPHNHKVTVPLPTEEGIHDYLTHLTKEMKDWKKVVKVGLDAAAKSLVGLSRVHVRNVFSLAVNNEEKVTGEFLADMKKDLIETECAGLLEFIESPFQLDHVAGHTAAKQWLREDAKLLRRGKAHALPMGYLFCGRIGTGKTFLTMCWAGEIGIPCVVFKNFRDKWVGATEGNLEKIFTILHALGQVLVFVDEADQATGKRSTGGDTSGVGGRVYGMLAKEMSDTRNRGKILWVFATSRPDLLEVDLKRQGRLDVHIPLFPPQTPEERDELFRAMARKVKLAVPSKELPPVPPELLIGGNEMEGLLVRANRVHELQEGDSQRPMAEIVAELLREMRPSAHTLKLEYMDLVAVKECTDARFLPPKYRDMPMEDVEKRIAHLAPFM